MADDLDLPKAEASSKEVLATKANKAADATSGPDEAPSGTTYVTWTRPDGTSTVAPLSNSATYEAKGFKKGAEFEMDSITAWNAENAAQQPATATSESGEKPSEEATPEHQSAGDLVEQARTAQTSEELDAIEAQADGRVTVIDAVAKRRAELSSQAEAEAV